MGWKTVTRGGLSRRNKTFYFRIRVPEELVPKVGKTHIAKSLGTSDYKLAKDRFVREAAAVLKEFDRHRNSFVSNNLVSDGSGLGQQFADLTIIELRSKVASWFRREHQNIPYAYPFLFNRNERVNDHVKDDGPADDELETKDQAIWNHSRLLHTLTAGQPQEIDEAINPVIAHFCKEEKIVCEYVRRSEGSLAFVNKIVADHDSPKFRTFRTMILRGKIELLQQQIAYRLGLEALQHSRSLLHMRRPLEGDPLRPLEMPSYLPPGMTPTGWRVRRFRQRPGPYVPAEQP